MAGFGGQGVVLAGQILGQAAAVFDRKYAAFTQNYGPEARGGSCTAEVVSDDAPIDYPYLTDPQIVVILSQDAYAKYGCDVSPQTLLIIDPDLVKTGELSNHKFLSVPANRMARQLGRSVVANIVLLGFVAAVSDFVSVDALRKSVVASVPKGTEDFNLKAFDAGYKYGIDNYPRKDAIHA